MKGHNSYIYNDLKYALEVMSELIDENRNNISAIDALRTTIKVVNEEISRIQSDPVEETTELTPFYKANRGSVILPLVASLHPEDSTAINLVVELMIQKKNNLKER